MCQPGNPIVLTLDDSAPHESRGVEVLMVDGSVDPGV